VDKTTGACTYADQAAANAAFATWLATATVSGGCAPTSVPSTTTAPPFCGGSVPVTWTISDKCYQTTTYTATFTITAPPAVVVGKAVDKTTSACIYADQAAANAAFATWLATATVSGGCAPTSVPSTTTAPPFCGGSVPVTWTISDKCYQTTTYTATFTITPPPAVVVGKAVDKTTAACTYADQAAADAAFATWLATATVSGGCAPTSVPSTRIAPPFCGGSVPVTWTISDKCYQTTTYTATFTITAPPAVVVGKAVDMTSSACVYADQAAADAAFATWLATATVSGGCAPTSVPSTTTAPTFCGGSVPVTWTISDKCYQTTTYMATFTITPPADVIVHKAADKIATACEFKDQAEVDAAFAAWLATATVEGGCAPTSTPDITTAPIWGGGSVTVTWTIKDKCYETTTYEATFFITPLLSCSITVDHQLTICGLKDGVMTVHATGGNGSYTYQWYLYDDQDPAVPQPIIGLTTATASGLDQGKYLVVVTDEDGCTTSCEQDFEPCTPPPKDFCTYTQGKYGNQNGSACDLTNIPNYRMGALMAKLMATDLVIGRAGRSLTFPAGSWLTIKNVMPGGGGSYALTGDCIATNATCLAKYLAKTGRLNNTLLAQTIALGLNLRITTENLLGDVILSGDGYLTTQLRVSCEKGSDVVAMVCEPYETYVNNVLTTCYKMTVDPYWYGQVNKNVLCYMSDHGYALTVQGLYDLANDALGGIGTFPAVISCSPTYKVSLSDIANVVDLINNAFDECRSMVGYGEKFTCSPCLQSGQLGVELKEATALKVYPNPFVNTVTFQFATDKDAKVILEVQNVLGQTLATLLNGPVKGGVMNTVEYQPINLTPGVLFYRLIINNEVQTGKVIYNGYR
jgi:hypothetical protein